MSSPRVVFRQLRSKARFAIGVEGAAVLLFAFAIFMLASYAADRTLRLEVGYRLVLLLIFIAVLVRSLHGRTLTPLAFALNDEEIALAVERADPELRQALISALQFEDVLASNDPVPESRDLMSAVVQNVEQRAGQMGLQRALDRRRIARFGGLLAVSLAVPIGWTVLDASSVRLWAMRNLALSGQEWPRDTHLSFVGVEGDTLRVAEGDDQTLIIRADGVVPEQAFLRYSFGGGETGIESMTLTGQNEFSFTLQSLLEDVTVSAEAGDGSTGDLLIQIVARPRIEGLTLTLSYPEYMEKEPTKIGETEGDIRIPRGGVVAVQARSDKQLKEASLNFGQDQRIELALADDGHSLSGRFEPPDTGLLTLNVIDTDRLDSAQPPRLFLRIVEDQEPKLDFKPTGIGTMITPIAIIPGRLEVQDDYGLVEVDASFQVSGNVESAAPAPAAAPVEQPPKEAPDAPVEEAPAPEKPVEPPWEEANVRGFESFVAGTIEWSEDMAFDLKDINQHDDPFSEKNRARPGQLISVRFNAVDNFGPDEPHRGHSEPMTFRVVTRDKLLGDLERRQTEQRRELEVIVTDEKAHVAELREILAPGSQDARAARAQLRVLAMARTQRALGKRVRNISDHYHQILQEFRNNRILEPSKVDELTAQIVDPLRKLAEEEFPASADSTKEFANSGKDDVRDVAVLSYESIIQRLEQVLTHMKELENFATLLEDLRRVIKLQNSAITETQKRAAEQAESIFPTDPPKPPKQPKGNKKKKK